jgi:tripartite-type tricarboxylate transporter receptor subunit TctC
MELFKLNAGINVTHVAYKGADAAIRDLSAGVVNAMFVPGESIVSLVKAGRMHVLAVLGNDRNPLFPNVPTVREEGFPNVNVRAWIGLMAPAATPSEIVQKLNSEMNAIFNLPEIQESVLKRTGVPDNGGGSSEKLAEIIQSDLDLWTRLVAQTGLKAD